MKKLILISMLLFFSAGLTMAQTYENSVGIRAGYSSGINYKHLIHRNYYVDLLALYNKDGFQFTVLYEYQYSPYAREQLQYYVGIGSYGGNWDDEFAIGGAILLGSEYVFRKAPVIIGLEWKPMVNLYKQIDYAIPDIAITLKVILD